MKEMTFSQSLKTKPIQTQSNPILPTPKGVKQKSVAGSQRSVICLLPSVFAVRHLVDCLLYMAMREKSILAIIIVLLFRIRPLRTNTSISEMKKSLSARNFQLKIKFRCLKLDGKKILQHIGNLIYIIRNSGPVAQRLEQWTHNPLVVGSNPTGPSDIKNGPTCT